VCIKNWDIRPGVILITREPQQWQTTNAAGNIVSHGRGQIQLPGPGSMLKLSLWWPLLSMPILVFAILGCLLAKIILGYGIIASLLIVYAIGVTLSFIAQSYDNYMCYKQYTKLPRFPGH
jgi:hypothetical protein